MPSPSKAQRRLFAIAEHHPESLNPENRRLADLPHKTLHDFAATPEKGLPEHVKHMASGWSTPYRSRRLAVPAPVAVKVKRFYGQ